MAAILDPGALLDSLTSSALLTVLLVSAAAGIVGALARKLAADGATSAGLAGAILVGAVAGIAVVTALPPTNAMAWIALGLVGGYSGKALLDVLAARIEQGAAREQAAEVARVGRRIAVQATALAAESCSAGIADKGPGPGELVGRAAAIRALAEHLAGLLPLIVAAALLPALGGCDDKDDANLIAFSSHATQPALPEHGSYWDAHVHHADPARLLLLVADGTVRLGDGSTAGAASLCKDLPDSDSTVPIIVVPTADEALLSGVLVGSGAGGGCGGTALDSALITVRANPGSAPAAGPDAGDTQQEGGADAAN